MNKDVILTVENLKQYFKLGNSINKAVDGVSFEVMKGETFGLVGESGSGKSTLGRSIIRLYDPTDGDITFDGVQISEKLSKEDRKHLRLKMQMIFQDPMASLNQRKKVIDIIAQGLDIHRLYKSNEERKQKVIEILEKVGLSKDHINRYPHQFSGGQRQRIGIARALIMKPELVVVDEAISALDVSIQAQVVNLMKKIQKEYNMTYIFIAHDLSMVKYISDRIAVMHSGKILELGNKDEIFGNPVHPYTKSLISAIPHANPVYEKNRVLLEYDKEGIDYDLGKWQQVSESHFVLATDNQLKEWSNI